MSISDNIKRIRDTIADTAVSSGREVDSVKLIAVTKYVDTARIQEAVDAGITSVGENRVQECMDKYEFFCGNNLSVNLIGQLQTNKVKYVTGKVSLIQSVDRLSLAQQLDHIAVSRGVIQDVLIEINIAQEPQKGGLSPERNELFDLLAEISAMKGVRVRGLMCVPPAVGEREVRGYFAKLRELSFDVRDAKIPNIHMDELSMGMSGDYTSAIRDGATMVRIGSAIFGPRVY